MPDTVTYRVPLRLSLGGGGTDLVPYSSRFGGRVVGAALDAPLTITVRSGDRPGPDLPDGLARDLVAAARQQAGIDHPVSLEAAGRLPSGIGLGSSSAFCVGLVAALHALGGRTLDPATAAELAFAVEHEVRGGAPGRQDHYLAALGGLRVVEFARDGGVTSRRLPMTPCTFRVLQRNVHLYDGGQTRDAADVLRGQAAAMEARGCSGFEPLHRIRDLAEAAIEALGRGDVDRWGTLLHEHWVAKRATSDRISRPELDRFYDRLRASGAVLGGKLSGAGGGGVLMLYVAREHEAVAEAVTAAGFRRLPLGFTDHGLRAVA